MCLVKVTDQFFSLSSGRLSQYLNQVRIHLFPLFQYLTLSLGEGPPIDDGYIEPSKPRDEVRQEPYPLPKEFEWSFLDIGDPKQVHF